MGQNVFGVAPVVIGGIVTILASMVIVGGVRNIAKVSSTGPFWDTVGIYAITGIAIVSSILRAIPNLISLLFLSGVIVRETRKYLWEGDIDQDGLPSGGAEWEEAHLQQAPMCFCEWEADDCYGAEQTHDNMKYGNFPPASDNPQNIEGDLKATAVRHNLHIFSKWTKRQNCQFE